MMYARQRVMVPVVVDGQLMQWVTDPDTLARTVADAKAKKAWRERKRRFRARRQARIQRRGWP